MDGAVFSQIVSLRERRDRLADAASTPAELEPITKAELEELRHLARPPEQVRRILELVYIVLHASKFRSRVQRLPSGGRADVPWDTVQMMLARFESFFPSMASYNITPLVSAPEVVDYILGNYLDGATLTEERVRTSNRAAAALFRWCGSAMARAQAALELAAVNVELLELERHQQPEPQPEQEQQQPQQQEQQEGEQEQREGPPPRWECEVDGEWVEYPEDIARRLSSAADSGGRARFSMNREVYEVDLAERMQRNLRTGWRRPVRPM